MAVYVVDEVVNNLSEGGIEIQVDEAARLFHTLDPFPFRERDLAKDAEEFIIGWARKIPKGRPITIVVHLPKAEVETKAGRMFGDVLHDHFGAISDRALFACDQNCRAVCSLHAVRKGGRVVCAGIHMSDIPSFPYSLLWEERQLLSVANLTRRDGIEFFKIVPQAGIQIHTTTFPLDKANDALAVLRAGQLLGAAVLQP